MPELTDLCKRWWEKLEKEGCSYESATVSNGILFSVDVPNTTDIYRVYQILSDAENEGVWGFEEAHVGHRLND